MAQKYYRLTIRRTAGLLILAGVVAGAAGCAIPGEGPSARLAVDPSSQVAKDALYAAKHPGPFPRFADIPKIPTDIPPASAWRAATADLQRRKAQVVAEASALPPPLADTQPFADRSRALAKAPIEPPPPDSDQQTQADAAALRERATPPPPPK